MSDSHGRDSRMTADDDKPEVHVGKRLVEEGFTEAELRMLADRVLVGLMGMETTDSDERVHLGKGLSTEKEAALLRVLREFVGQDPPPW